LTPSDGVRGFQPFRRLNAGRKFFQQSSGSRWAS
jgi:hypothetical protein